MPLCKNCNFLVSCLSCFIFLLVFSFRSLFRRYGFVFSICIVSLNSVRISSRCGFTFCTISAACLLANCKSALFFPSYVAYHLAQSLHAFVLLADGLAESLDDFVSRSILFYCYHISYSLIVYISSLTSDLYWRIAGAILASHSLRSPTDLRKAASLSSAVLYVLKFMFISSYLFNEFVEGAALDGLASLCFCDCEFQFASLLYGEAESLHYFEYGLHGFIG